MRKYVLVLLGLLFLTDEISCFLRLPRHAEFQYRDVVDAKLSQGARTRRSIGGVSHPEWYDLDLDVEGSNIKLHLTRNDDLSTVVPTLALNTGVLTEIYLKDQEESIFYQDIINGASFVVQYNRSKSQHMFGTFHQDGNDYILQKDQRNTDSLLSGVNRFEIIKEIKEDLILDDFLQPPEVETVKVHKTIRRHHRQKRATGSNQIELLIVCDYAVYKYWYDQSDKTTAMEKEADAESSVRQYYAFVLNGMDAMYKNIQTTSYSISVLFAGIVIAKTADDSTWTENIKNTSFTPNTVNSDQSLQDFKTWMNANSGSLPNHDHAMLFTRYNLEYNGSTGNAGLAYLGTICGTWRQSIVEDKFNFIIITVAAHELGHGLSSNHDGDGNNCLATDAYIMAPSSGAKVGEKATHPWIFSSCSTDYFTTKIDELEATNENCMKSLGSGFDPTALTPYDQNLPGLIYDADAQCMQIYGNDSYLCRFPYENNYTTICTTMYCYEPAVDLCYGKIPGDGTLCDNKKFCTTGMCKDDVNAPQGDENCLYGDNRGKIFSNVNWTCAEMVEIAPHNCDLVPEKCCSSCAPFLNPTTTVTQFITTEYKMTETPSTTQMIETQSTTQMTETPSTTQMTKTLSTTQMTETPSTTQMTETQSTTQMTETPSTTQMTTIPSTTQMTKTLSTTQMTETPSTTQMTETQSTTQMTTIPSTTQMTKTLSTTQMTETQSTTQMTETPSTTQMTETPSTPQITEAPPTTQMTQTLSTAQRTETPSTTQMTETPITTQTTKTPSITQMTETPSTTQTTKKPTTQMTETQSTTQMTETPSTTQMTQTPSATEVTQTPTSQMTESPTTQTTETQSTTQTTKTQTTQMTETQSTTQMTETPSTTQMTQTLTTQTTKTPSTTQMTETPSTTQTTKKPTTQMAETPSTTQMTQTPSATEMTQTQTSQMTESPTTQTPETQSTTQTTKTKTTQMTETQSSTQMTETPSTTQMKQTLTTQTAKTPSTTQMTETPSTTQTTKTPTTQMTETPSTTQMTQTSTATEMTQTQTSQMTESPTTQIPETQSTTQMTETPSTTQMTQTLTTLTTKTPSITQMTETPSTTKTTKTPTTQMTETQSTTQMTETSLSTTQMTTITSTTQMTETLSATEMAQTPTSQITESPTASQTTETQSATQMTQTQSTTQMTESPTRTQMSETQPTTQMIETPSTKVMTEKSSTTQIIEKSTASLMTKDATITQVTDSTKQATNQNKDTTEQKKTTTQLDETTTLQSFKTSPSENATYSESTKKAGVTTKLGTPTMTITSEAETWPDITSMIPETTVLSQSTRKFQGAMTLAKDWNPSYSDEDSTEYQSLKANFTEQLTEMYSKTSLKDDFVNVTITGFREGSVVVDYILELQSNAPQTEQNIVTITKQAVDDIKADQSSNLDLITEVNSQLVSLTEVIETTTTGTTTGLTIQDSGDIGIGLIAAIVAVTVVVLIIIVGSAVVIVTWKRSKEKRITSDNDSTYSQTIYHRHRGYDNHGMVSDYTGRQGSYMEHYMPRGLPLYQGHQNFQDSLTSSTQFY